MQNFTKKMGLAIVNCYCGIAYVCNRRIPQSCTTEWNRGISQVSLHFVCHCSMAPVTQGPWSQIWELASPISLWILLNFHLQNMTKPLLLNICVCFCFIFNFTGRLFFLKITTTITTTTNAQPSWDSAVPGRRRLSSHQAPRLSGTCHLHQRAALSSGHPV